MPVVTRRFYTFQDSSHPSTGYIHSDCNNIWPDGIYCYCLFCTLLIIILYRLLVKYPFVLPLSSRLILPLCHSRSPGSYDSNRVQFENYSCGRVVLNLLRFRQLQLFPTPGSRFSCRSHPKRMHKTIGSCSPEAHCFSRVGTISSRWGTFVTGVTSCTSFLFGRRGIAYWRDYHFASQSSTQNSDYDTVSCYKQFS